MHVWRWEGNSQSLSEFVPSVYYLGPEHQTQVLSLAFTHHLRLWATNTDSGSVCLLANLQFALEITTEGRPGWNGPKEIQARALWSRTRTALIFIAEMVGLVCTFKVAHTNLDCTALDLDCLLWTSRITHLELTTHKETSSWHRETPVPLSHVTHLLTCRWFSTCH